jgi:transcriptional regulator with XRE-family HTH domain
MTGKQIVALRKKLGITQRQLAEEIASTPATVARWETGQHTPRGGYLKALLELEKTVKKLGKNKQRAD